MLDGCRRCERTKSKRDRFSVHADVRGDTRRSAQGVFVVELDSQRTLGQTWHPHLFFRNNRTRNHGNASMNVYVLDLRQREGQPAKSSLNGSDSRSALSSVRHSTMARQSRVFVLSAKTKRKLYETGSNGPVLLRWRAYCIKIQVEKRQVMGRGDPRRRPRISPSL